jgi:hypothetical protein
MENYFYLITDEYLPKRLDNDLPCKDYRFYDAKDKYTTCCMTLCNAVPVTDVVKNGYVRHKVGDSILTR